MSKSRARFLAEVLGTTGLVKKSKSALAGADEVIDLTSLPSLPNSKLTNSSISIAGHSTALGGSVTLDTADIGEDTNLYYTDTRARAAISVSGNAISYNNSTGVLTANFEEGPVFTGSVTAAGLTSSATTNINAAFTVKNNYNETKFVRNADVSSVGAAGYYLSIGALNGSSVVTPNVINAVTDTDGTSNSFAIMQDGANSLSFNSSKNATFSGHVTISGTNNVYVGDNGKFIAGASDDLQIYHNVNDSIIRDAGTGRLIIGSSEFLVTNAALSETQIKSIEDGAVSLYHNGQEKLETTSTGIDVTGVAVVDGLTSSGAVTSTSGSNSFGATTFTSGITLAGLTSSAAVTSTTSNSNAFGGTNFTGTVSVNGNTLSDTSRNVYTNSISAAGNVTVTGNLTVNGTTTTINAATLDVEDKNITLNYGSGDTSSSANGAGITIQDAVDSSTDASITWSTAGDNFNVSHSWNTLGYLQHTGVLYSRNNLLVLNSAGNGWNTWATRSNGNFNLNVGTVTTSGNISVVGSEVRVQRPSGGTSYFGILMDTGEKVRLRNSYANKDIYFDRDGNVGIGTASPGSLLHVYDGNIELQSPSGSGGRYISLNNTHTGGRDYRFISTSDSHGSLGGGDFAILDNDISGNDAAKTRLLIDSSGNVGIGTASPAFTLDVTGSFRATSDAYLQGDLYVNDKIRHNGDVDNYISFPAADTQTFVTANSERMRINSSGRVGINTDSPYSLLHINRTATDAYTAGAFNDVPVLTLMHTNADTQYAGIRFTNTVGNYEHFFGSVQTSSNTADMVFQGYDRAASTYKEYLRINDGGNVGIGTNNPSENLHVKNISSNAVVKVETAGGLDARLILDAPAAGGAQSQIFFDASGTTAGSIQYTHNSGGTNFMTFGTGGSNTERMRIDSSGNVGIGTTNPQHKLDTVGTIRHTSNIVSNTVYKAFSIGSNRTINDYGGLNKDYWAIQLATPGANTDGQSSAHAYGALKFSGVSAADTTLDDVLVLNYNGNVGIGTENPGKKLEVAAAGNTDGIRITGNSANTSLIINNTGSNGVAWDITSTGAGHGYGEGALHFGVAFGTPKMKITSAGNVGIGTTDPNQNLTVRAANAKISAQSTADGQTVGFQARYQNHTTLYGSFEYTTGDAQLYIDNNFIGNNGVYSDINFRNKENAGATLINRLKIKGSTGHVGIGVTTPAHQLTVQHDTDPSIYIVGNGYNDTVRIGFGGGDVNNVMGNGNTGAIISSAQTTSGGAALGDLRFQINKGDNLQTALHLSNQGYATFDHQGNDYGLDIKSSGSSRSGLVIRTPGTTNIAGSLLVLADTTYRLGTGSYYHLRMDQDGKTQVGSDKEVSIGDHYGNNYTAARFNVNAGTGTGAGATGKTVWYGPKGRGHKSFAGQDAFNIYDLQREWTGKHVDNGGNSVTQTSSQNYTNDHGISVNYPNNVTSSQLIYSDTPKGGAGTILRAQADSVSTWNGGFQSNGFPCSTHVGLQYSMYVRRASSQSAGTLYIGCYNAYPGGTSTTVNTNPYFIVTSMASLPQGVWCLAVAYLCPINYNGTLPAYTGIYRLDTGSRITGQTHYRHYSTTQNIRTYMYYAGDSLTKCDWYAPRIHLVDGTEPSITQLMGYGRVYGSSTDL